MKGSNLKLKLSFIIILVKDLIKNYKLKGLTYGELLDKLGQPTSTNKSMHTIYYNIMTNYGVDVDPIASLILEFKFNKDSIVSDFQLVNL